MTMASGDHSISMPSEETLLVPRKQEKTNGCCKLLKPLGVVIVFVAIVIGILWILGLTR